LANNLAQRKVSLTAYITKDAVRDQINRVIGGKDSQKFITSIISAVNANPALQDCENSSILSGALLGASLKLSPSPQLGHYYLVPFNDKNKGKVAQFILGYKGYIQLAIRSGMYKRLNVTAIKEGELIKYDPLTEEIEVSLIEDEDVRENTPTVGYYAMYEYNNGFRKSLYWSKKKMENHANKYSKGYSARKGYTFWEKGFDSMAAKTMIRQLIGKWGIMSIEMQNAYESDGAVINDDGSKNYVELAEDNIINVAAESEETIENNTASVDVDIDVKDTTAAAEKAGF
jgi:recombination protein RecT